jgi:hypothetical protein
MTMVELEPKQFYMAEGDTTISLYIKNENGRTTSVHFNEDETEKYSSYLYHLSKEGYTNINTFNIKEFEECLEIVV